MAVVTATPEPNMPLTLRWAGPGDPLGCRFCDTGLIPAEDMLVLSGRDPRYTSELHMCPGCAERADPDTAHLADALETAWQLLLTRHDHGTDTETAVEALREMADELERLRDGQRDIHTLRIDLAEDGVRTIYTTIGRGAATYEPPTGADV